MTINDMRELLAMPLPASDASVVFAFASLIADGRPDTLAPDEPVTVDMVRDQCGIVDEIPDSLINQKIRAARDWAEDYTGRVLSRQSLVAHFRSWGSYLEISKRPIISIDAIACEGAAGDGIYAEAAFSIHAAPLLIFPGPGGFPALRTGGGIIVAYTAGFDPTKVPGVWIEAMLVFIAGALDQREGAYQASIGAAEDLLWRQRVPAL